MSSLTGRFVQKGRFMTSPAQLSHSLCVAVDARGYGASDDHTQLSIQRHLLELLDTAAAAAGLCRLSWSKQPGGDAELAVLPAGESEVLVVDRFVRELDAALHRHNRDRLRTARLQVRMVVHFGRLLPGPNGYAGPAPVEVSRLLNSRQLRQALAESKTRDLVVLLSNQVYTDTVEPLHTTWRPDEFRRVRIHEKEFEADAWLWTPDGSPQDSPSPTPVNPAAGRPQQVVHNKVDQVTSDSVVFGIQNV